MEYTYQLKVWRQGRQNILDFVAPYSDEQLLTIPEGFSNNILWQMGHILVTQQIACYTLSYNQPTLDSAMIEAYRNGSTPTQTETPEDIKEIKELLHSSVDTFCAALPTMNTEKFKTYTPSYKVEMTSIQDAITLNNVHEALHLGLIMSLRKFV
jgi:hypothetical protein